MTTTTPRLMTPTVAGMWAATRADWGRAPILADAMEEAGCEDVRLLADLRTQSRGGVDGRRLTAALGVRVAVQNHADYRPASRRTARTLDHEDCNADCAGRALCSASGRYWLARHGGGVANNYGYAALTDGVLCAAVYDPPAAVVRVCWWAATLPANKVTTAGVCAAFGLRDLCDRRVSEARRVAAVEDLFRAVTTAK